MGFRRFGHSKISLEMAELVIAQLKKNTSVIGSSDAWKCLEMMANNRILKGPTVVIPPNLPQSSPNRNLRFPHLKPPYTFKIQDLQFNWAMNDNQPQMLISLFHQEFRNGTVPKMERFHAFPGFRLF